MKSGKIIIVGSSNMDMVVKADHIPVPGETVLGGRFFMIPGGKGANQAVAVARLGGEAIFVSRVGNDTFGKQFSDLFRKEGIDTSHLLFDQTHPSGVALISVDKTGENSIVVASGANAQLMQHDLEVALEAIGDAAIVLLQLEIPMETVNFVVGYAAARGIRVILNPAPANSIRADVLQKVDILTPNATEAATLSGLPVTDMATAGHAAKALCDMGVPNVIVTMGSSGVLVCERGTCQIMPVRVVETVDSTAAGDVFNGGLAVAMAEGKTLVEAVAFACEAATLSVMRLGAQSSIPYRNEVIA